MPRALTRRTDDPLQIGLYHICSVNNLSSVLESGALLPFNVLQARKINYSNIALEHLQERRDNEEVPVGPKGNLHDYVPFYFAARSPMLGSVANTHRADPAFQDDILYFVSSVACIQDARCEFVFTDGHPLSQLSQYSKDLQALPQVLDWDVLSDEWWNQTRDRKRKRQAEFLVHHAVPWQAVRGIAVRCEAAKLRVEALLSNLEYQPKVVVVPEWYYEVSS